MAWLPLIAAVAMLLCFYLCTLCRQMLALDEYSQLDVVDEQLEGVRCEPSPSPSPLPYAR